MGSRIVFAGSRCDILHICYTADFTAKVPGLASTDFTATLMVKEPLIGAWAASTDPVSWGGQVLVAGVGGQYSYYFSPTKEGQYELLVKNLAGGTTALETRYEFTVIPQGAALVGSYTDAFCAQSDIETQTGYEIGAATNPTDVEVADMAVLRASLIQGHLMNNGVTVTPDAGVAPISVASTQGQVLRNLVRLANAVGAGADQIRHANRGVKPEKSNKADQMEKLWESLLSQITAVAKQVYDFSLIETPYSVGQVEEPDRTDLPEGSLTRVTLTGDEL